MKWNRTVGQLLHVSVAFQMNPHGAFFLRVLSLCQDGNSFSSEIPGDVLVNNTGL